MAIGKLTDELNKLAILQPMPRDLSDEEAEALFSAWMPPELSKEEIDAQFQDQMQAQREGKLPTCTLVADADEMDSVSDHLPEQTID